MIAVACDAEGRREIVGLHIRPSEAETFWAAFLNLSPGHLKPISIFHHVGGGDLEVSDLVHSVHHAEG
jgi:hypothetical protein